MCQNKKQDVKRLARALAAGHTSLREHASFTFEIVKVSRVLSHQLVRHRIASYAQQSQRTVAIQEPDWSVIPDTITGDHFAHYKNLLTEIQRFYNDMQADGIPLEDARYILPNGTHTSLIMTMNARELFFFFKLRCCRRAQWEIRELAYLILEQVRFIAPVIFKGAGAQCKECKETCAHYAIGGFDVNE
jgi:thymidylate synthase (FAD)